MSWLARSGLDGVAGQRASLWGTQQYNRVGWLREAVRFVGLLGLLEGWEWGEWAKRNAPGVVGRGVVGWVGSEVGWPVLVGGHCLDDAVEVLHAGELDDDLALVLAQVDSDLGVVAVGEAFGQLFEGRGHGLLAAALAGGLGALLGLDRRAHV